MKNYLTYLKSRFTKHRTLLEKFLIFVFGIWFINNLVNLGFYLMNKSDTFYFNIGLLCILGVFISFLILISILIYNPKQK